MLNQKLLVA